MKISAVKEIENKQDRQAKCMVSKLGSGILLNSLDDSRAKRKKISRIQQRRGMGSVQQGEVMWSRKASLRC